MNIHAVYKTNPTTCSWSEIMIEKYILFVYFFLSKQKYLLLKNLTFPSINWGFFSLEFEEKSSTYYLEWGLTNFKLY